MSEVPSIVSAHGELNVYVYRSLQVFWRGNCRRGDDMIRTSIYDKYSGSTEITTHPDHISRCKRAPGTNWPNR